MHTKSHGFLTWLFGVFYRDSEIEIQGWLGKERLQSGHIWLPTPLGNLLVPMLMSFLLCSPMYPALAPSEHQTWGEGTVTLM